MKLKTMLALTGAALAVGLQPVAREIISRKKKVRHRKYDNLLKHHVDFKIDAVITWVDGNDP
jgi:hypothetical protein